MNGNKKRGVSAKPIAAYAWRIADSHAPNPRSSSRVARNAVPRRIGKADSRAPKSIIKSEDFDEPADANPCPKGRTKSRQNAHNQDMCKTVAIEILERVNVRQVLTIFDIWLSKPGFEEAKDDAGTDDRSR